MTITVYINQEAAGTLNMTQDGLYTVFEAEVPGITDRLVRLWAHGQGQSVYLGVMQPWSGGLYLQRKLTRLQRAAFPDPVEYVSDQEEAGSAERQDGDNSEHKMVDINYLERQKEMDAEPEVNTATGDKTDDTEDLHNINNITIEQNEAESECMGDDREEQEKEQLEGLHNQIETTTDNLQTPKMGTDTRSCPWPAELPEEGLLWYHRGDGSLTSFDGISRLLAIPAELRRSTPQMAERVIEGKKYLVFRT